MPSSLNWADMCNVYSRMHGRSWGRRGEGKEGKRDGGEEGRRGGGTRGGGKKQVGEVQGKWREDM